MLLFKQSFICWLVISHDPAGRLASARREYLGGSSTKDDGGKHLRALPAPNQEGSEDMFLGSSTFKNPVEVPVSDLCCLIYSWLSIQIKTILSHLFFLVYVFRTLSRRIQVT